MLRAKVCLISIYFVLIIFTGCNRATDKEKLFVYNWGIYIDDSVISKFEDKYDCEVIYDTFDTNEEMYAVVKEGGRVYDILCPTDYMIEKMIKQNLLYSFDFNDLKNIVNIDKDMLKIMTSFDTRNSYAIPYVHSTIGLIYNKTILDEKKLPYPKKWADLWNEDYKGEILMQDAMRDLLMVGLKKNNFSMNTLSQEELDIATGDLIKQKHLVNAYLIDPLRDKMVMGDGSIAVMYSGEVEYIKNEGKFEYEYILPEEGANLTIDAWVIPRNAKNKPLAKKWIDFMLEPEIALLNFNYMHYGISNIPARAMSNYWSPDVFPDLSDVSKYELYKDLGDFENNYSTAFKKIKS